MRVPRTLLAALFAVAGLAMLSPEAHAGSREGKQALDELKNGRKAYNVVQNRFFLKAERFELAPVLGVVPNNPFVQRYTGGVFGAYHFSEVLAVEGAFLYAPDLGAADLKDLTHTLVAIAQEGNTSSGFQQPIEKMTLGATFAARWAPVYGKINLIGERVLNFDFYGILGLGMLSITEYYATYNADNTPPTEIIPQGSKVKVPVNIGVGFDFFISSSIALKIDARSYLYADKQPQYDPKVPVTKSRVYNNFVASAGVGIFFPKMKPRQYNF